MCLLSKEKAHTELTARSEAAEEAVVAPLFGRLPFLKRAPPRRMAKGSMSGVDESLFEAKSTSGRR